MKTIARTFGIFTLLLILSSCAKAESAPAKFPLSTAIAQSLDIDPPVTAPKPIVGIIGEIDPPVTAPKPFV